MRSVLPSLILLLLASPALAGDAPAGTDWGFTEVDGIELGEPVVGKTITHHDLRGRVVLLYQWGITCPISTGAFPAVNALVEKYPDLVVVGFQVRRNPEVLAENVQYYLNYLRPEFPVRRLGDDWEWPAKYLPWGLLYDHTGRKIYGGSLQGIDARIDAALEKAGDWQIGGPYVELAELAEKMTADRGNLGTHLVSVRRLAGAEEASPKRAEARALLARVTLWHGWRMEKAEEAPDGPVGAAGIYQDLGARFAGDPLAVEPAKRLKEIAGKETYGAEVLADAALDEARAVFRFLPPAGTYAYNMDYAESTDARLKATRARMIVEFRDALERIVSHWPKTHAASEARDLLFLHDVPFLEEDAARECLVAAKDLLAKGKTPVELCDAWLLLEQLSGGYFGEDAVSREAADLLARFEKRAGEVRVAGQVHRRCNAVEAELRYEVQLAGSALLSANAEELIEKLMKNARNAGKHSRVAKRTRAFVETLEKSYAGPANLGVVFDTRWTNPGARVRYVYPRSAAERDGIQVGDVLLAIDDTDIDSAATMGPFLSKKKPGDTVKIQIRRGRGEESATVDVAVVLGRNVR